MINMTNMTNISMRQDPTKEFLKPWTMNNEKYNHGIIKQCIVLKDNQS